jgi:hypothetical protein
MRKIIPFVLLSIFFVGCGASTPYIPYVNNNGLGGYENRYVGDNRQIVAFYVNNETDDEVHMAMFLYRCAEVTLANKFSYFQIVDGFSKIPIRKPGFNRQRLAIRQCTIVMYNGEPKELLEDMYIAKDVMQKLRPIVSKQSITN